MRAYGKMCARALLALVYATLSYSRPLRPLLSRGSDKSRLQAVQLSLDLVVAGPWLRGRVHNGPEALLSKMSRARRAHAFDRVVARHQGNVTESSALTVVQRLLICSVTLGDGRAFKVLVDTGSGNLAVPSADCRSDGCRGRRGFEPEDDSTGQFLPGATDLHLGFATGKLDGSGFRGRVCFGHMCGQISFLVAAAESAEFQHFGFDGILGLGPPRQALASGFNVLGSLASQGVLPQAAFLLSLRSRAQSSLTLGTVGNFSWNGSTPAWLSADARHGEWAVHLQDIRLDGKVSEACGKDGCRAVLDSGCAGIAIPAPALKKIKDRLQLESCSESSIQELPTLGFVLGNGHTYEVRPEKYVEISSARISEELTEDEADDGPHCRLLIQPTGDFSARTAILGLPFLFDRDIAFDQEHMRVGLSEPSA